jgi:hypothetical protein
MKIIRLFTSIVWVSIGIYALLDGLILYSSNLNYFGFKYSHTALVIIQLSMALMVIFGGLSCLFKKGNAQKIMLIISSIVTIYITTFLLFGDEGSVLYRVTLPIFGLFLCLVTIVTCRSIEPQDERGSDEGGPNKTDETESE